MEIVSSKLVQFNDGKIILDMGFDSRAFAKSKLISYKDEKGWIYTPNSNSAFMPWQFDDIIDTAQENSSSDGIQLVGKGNFSFTFLDYLNDESISKQKKIPIFQNVIQAMEDAISLNVTIEQTGPEGILLSEQGEILFLPPTLFLRAAEARNPEDFSKNYGMWVNTALKTQDGLRFTEGVYAYRLLSGIMPYSNTDTEQRHADYFDQNFLPIELATPGINPILAEAINGNLAIMGELYSAKKAKKQTKNLAECVPLPVELISIPNPTEEEISVANEKKLDFEKKQDKRVSKARFFRKKDTSVKIGILVLIGIAIAAFIYYTDSLTNHTAKGLNSVEIVQAMYTGINELDVPLLQSVCKGSGTTSLIDSLSSHYVTISIREAVDFSGRTLPPTQWLYANNPKNGLFGVTNLILQEDSSLLVPNLYPPQKKDRPKPITTENGKELSQGDTVTYKVKYYFIRNAAPQILSVSERIDEITLEYRKNSWYVVDIDRTEEYTQADLTVFWKDFNDAVTIAQGDVVKAVNSIRDKYVWLPSDKELKEITTTL